MMHESNSAHAELFNQQKNKLLTLALKRTIDDEYIVQKILEQPFHASKRVTAADVYSVQKDYADFLGKHSSNALMCMCRNYFSSQIPSLIIRRFIDKTEDGDQIWDYSVPFNKLAETQQHHFLFDEILDTYIQHYGIDVSAFSLCATSVIIWISGECVYVFGLGELAAIFDPIVDKMSAEFFTGSSVNMV